MTTSFFEVIDRQIRHKISEDFLTSTSKQTLQMRCLHPSSYRFAFLLQTQHKIGNFELGSARMIGLRPLRASLTMSSWKIKHFWPNKIKFNFKNFERFFPQYFHNKRYQLLVFKGWYTINALSFRCPAFFVAKRLKLNNDCKKGILDKNKSSIKAKLPILGMKIPLINSNYLPSCMLGLVQVTTNLQHITEV